LSATAATPLPLTVRATIAVGRSVVDSASVYASSIARGSWPSTSIARQPMASRRRA
jgi:hypothetical protein